MDDTNNTRSTSSTIKFKRWEGNSDLPLPGYSSAGAAGFDFRACLPEGSIKLRPGDFKLVSTGFAMMIPEALEVQIRPRSGLAAKHGISIVNAPGTIDCDYRGLVQVCLINLGPHEFEISHGDRIAQGVVAAAPQYRLVEVAELSETERGEGGFGSTGVA